MKLVFALLSIITLATLLVAQSPRPLVLKVRESNILSEIAERKKIQPTITAKKLTAFANELLEKKGFDYSFEVCDILSSRDKKSTASSMSKRYRASLTNGQELMLNLDVSNPSEGLCGECWIRVPSRRVTEREIHLISRGKTYRIRRTSAFHLDDAQLVDETLKKVLRKWEFPDQSVPIGISPDGTKLYVDVQAQESLDDIVLEVSEDGTLAFRDRAGLALNEGTVLENVPSDPKNAYLSFVKFQSGNKTYIVRYTAPCT